MRVDVRISECERVCNCMWKVTICVGVTVCGDEGGEEMMQLYARVCTMQVRIHQYTKRLWSLLMCLSVDVFVC